MRRIYRHALLFIGCAWHLASTCGMAAAGRVELVMDVRETGQVRHQMGQKEILSWVVRWEVRAPQGSVTELVRPGAREVDGHWELIVGVVGSKIYNGKFEVHGYASAGAKRRGELVATLVVVGSKIRQPTPNAEVVSWLNVRPGSATRRSVGAGRLRSYAEVRLVRTVGTTCKVAYLAPGTNQRRVPTVEKLIQAELGPQRVKTTPDGQRVPSLQRSITVRAHEDAPAGLRLSLQGRTPKGGPWVTVGICVKVVSSVRGKDLSGTIGLNLDVRKTGRVRHQMGEGDPLSWVDHWEAITSLGHATALVSAGAREVGGHWEFIVSVAGNKIMNGKFEIYGCRGAGRRSDGELVATLVVRGSKIGLPK